ncbi:nuclear transport factor 2 family protein [Pacificispira sp.]|uniref:nuclear transport factor 2 family protein n=1 Tax=Pacificispira sp. TaxID=2888761 RepID=UPI003B516F01
MKEDFENFLIRREFAAQAYSNGDPEPLRTMTAETGMATFFHHLTGYTEGAKAVMATYTEGAKVFEQGGWTRLEIKDQGSDDALAFWTGFQYADVSMVGAPCRTRLKVNVTEIFRHDGTTWRLVHRHASLPAAHEG